MPDLTQDYVFKTIRAEQAGTLGNFTDPAAPTDLGTSLTQAQIDFLKTFINELQNRFADTSGL